MSRMGIRVLHNQGLGHYPSGLFRRLGQELDPLVLKYSDRMWGVNLEHHLSASSANGGYE
jgi:hypothetical protein